VRKSNIVMPHLFDIRTASGMFAGRRLASLPQDLRQRKREAGIVAAMRSLPGVHLESSM
jgi:hypothetical protein